MSATTDLAAQCDTNPLQHAAPLAPAETRALRWCAPAILTLLVLDRIRLLSQFVFRYTDEDQSLLWYATTEIAHGRFHEPCFYGQAYNSVIESALAVPLHSIFQIPLPYALPMVTCILGLLPYMLMAGAAWARQRYIAASVILMVPLAMPLPYGMVTAMPRGFVTGLALASVAWLLFERHRGYIAWGFAGFLSILAGFLNPNASIFLLAIGISAWWKHAKYWQFYVTTLVGMAAAAPIPWFAYNFYKNHPTYDLLRHPPLKFTWKFWNQGIDKLDLLLGHFMPVGDSGRAVLIAFAALATALLLVMSLRGVIAILAAGGLCVYALGINRIHESSTPSIFLSGSRMFLAIPVVWALGIYWFDERVEKLPTTRWGQFLARYVLTPLHLTLSAAWQRRIALTTFGIVIIACVTIAAVRHRDYKETILTYVRERRLEVWSQEDYQISLAAITKAAAEKKTRLVLFTANQDKTLNYLVPALTDSKIESLYPPWERRTWRLQEESRNVHASVLIYLDGAKGKMLLYLNALNKFHNVEIVSKSPFIISLDPGGKTPVEVSRMLGIPVRKF